MPLTTRATGQLLRRYAGSPPRYNLAAAVEAARALLRSRRIASARVIFPRFAHRSRAFIVSDGSPTVTKRFIRIPGLFRDRFDLCMLNTRTDDKGEMVAALLWRRRRSAAGW